jgi:hypothetical protein
VSYKLANGGLASGLPDRYRGGAFVSERGRWDRPQFMGYKVVFVLFANGGAVIPPIGLRSLRKSWSICGPTRSSVRLHRDPQACARDG